MTPWWLATLAWVGSAPEVQFLDQLARQAYARGRFRDALTLFTEVAEVAPNAQTYFNMALAAQLSGDDAFAFSLFRRYLREDQGEKQRPQVAYAQQRIQQLSREFALVTVTSSPAGAQIAVGERNQETFETTPATLALEAGRHQIHLSKRDHRPGTDFVEARVGHRTQVHLDLAPRMGWVRVTVPGVPRARVRLISPDHPPRPVVVGEPESVPVGSYRLRVEAPGFKPFETPLAVKSEARWERRVPLVPLPPQRVKVLVRVRQGSFGLRVDGVEKARTPLALQLEVGPHLLEVLDRGQVVWSRRIDLRPGTNRLMDVDLEEPEAEAKNAASRGRRDQR